MSFICSIIFASFLVLFPGASEVPNHITDIFETVRTIRRKLIKVRLGIAGTFV
jgi:hypothetical protein